MKTLFFVLLSLPVLAAPLPDECFATSETSCTFYQSCVESVIPCGPKGYALSYGEHYCNVFESIVPKLSPKAQRWVHTTRECLQEKLSQEIVAQWDMGTLNELQCKPLRAFAFQTHSACYTQEQSSICSLDPHKDLPLIWRVLKASLFKSREGPLQVAEVLRICMKNHSKNKGFWSEKAYEYQISRGASQLKVPQAL